MAKVVQTFLQFGPTNECCSKKAGNFHSVIQYHTILFLHPRIVKPVKTCVLIFWIQTVMADLYLMDVNY